MLIDLQPGSGNARQFELHKTSGIYVIAWPVWEQDVPRVRLDNNGYCIGTYVRAA